MNWNIEHGDVRDVLASVPDCTYDAVLCDPPYGLAFMGKKWDYDVPSADLWREVLRVCKPGAPLIAFGGTRTYHRMVVQVEDAGFEIRDQIAWLYGSGFPKSLDVSKSLDKAAGAEREVVGKAVTPWKVKNEGSAAIAIGTEGEYRTFDITAPATPLASQWSGYGTSLKPAMEPAVLARRPLEGTVAANVAKWGVGGLAIDASRIEGPPSVGGAKADGMGFGGGSAIGRVVDRSMTAGRWPANVILDEEVGAALDAQSGVRKSGARSSGTFAGSRESVSLGSFGEFESREIEASSGGASRFFYCAKAARKERGEGNNHPTVKPVALMTYLARLIMPPAPGKLLVPFSGSGSEMIGALRAGWPDVTGIEREAEYVAIAGRRLRAA